MEYQEWLEAKCKAENLDIDNLTEFMAATLKAQYDAEVASTPELKPPAPVGPSVDDLCAERVEFYKREASLQAALSGHPALLAKALEEGWDEGRAKSERELAELKASRQAAPGFSIGGSADAGVAPARVLEASLARTLNIEHLDTHYTDRELEASTKKFRSGIGIQQLLLNCAAANGWSGDPIAFARDPGRLKEVLAAAFSTSDIDGILGNTANKKAAAAFMAVEQSWRRICKISPVGDFKQVTRYRLTGDLTYKRVNNGGEIEHGSLGEASYTNQAYTDALLLAISRNDIVNDDLGLLGDISARMGRGSALRINDEFWGEFLNNSAFFTASSPVNLLTGADSALGEDGLTAADLAFRNMTDDDDKPVALTPRILLVPNALLRTAKKLMNSSEIYQTAGAATNGTANTFEGEYEIVASSYLSNSTLTGYSSAAWYLLADPADMPVIECVFLNGQEMPNISSAEADFHQLGIQIRGFHDFGCSKYEPRAGVKSAGS